MCLTLKKDLTSCLHHIFLFSRFAGNGGDTPKSPDNEPGKYKTSTPGSTTQHSQKTSSTSSSSSRERKSSKGSGKGEGKSRNVVVPEDIGEKCFLVRELMVVL